MNGPRSLSSTASTLLLAASVVPGLSAQAGTVMGSVSDVQSRAALPGAALILEGTAETGLSGDDGRFMLIAVPAGDHVLRVELLGYRPLRRLVSVPADGAAVVDIALTPEPPAMDEIVVTSEAGIRRGREVGNTVARLEIDEVLDRPPTLSDFLQGAAVGVEVTGGSAEAGQGKQIRLRGNGSMVLSSHPLVYIDGVRMMEGAFPSELFDRPVGGLPGGANVTTSPLDLVSVGDIERIEVIKGPAATTLFGTGSSNGVIRIFTKRGVRGPPRWTAEVSQAGCGFELADSVAARGDGHAGLVGMQDRAALFGGDVAILTSPGNGTAVRATLPICPGHREVSRTVVRVLLVDEHAVVRAGLKALLETDERMEVVGEASTGEEAVEQARTLEPDIVIVDLTMPGMDGIRATRRMTELGLAAKVLVVTIHDEDEFLVPALNAGAAGFLNKSVADTELIGAIEAIVRGHPYPPRQATPLISRRRAQDNSSPTPALKVLSSREATAIELYASGLSARETGEEMFLSPKTVEGNLARAKAKLGLRTRRDIVRFALEAELLRAEGER